MPLRLISAVAILSLCAFTQNLTPEMQADINKRINFQRNWGSRASSPGAELIGVQTARREVGRGVYVMAYELKAKGLPLDIGYELLMAPTMAGSVEEIQSAGDFVLDKDGRVVNQDGSPYQLVVPDPAAGEPYRFGLSAKEGKHVAFVTLLPNAIESNDRGCKASVVRLMRNFELAFVQLSGFPPDAEIPARGNSEGEIHEFKLKTNAEGYADAGVLPFKLGKTKGKMEIQFTTPQCAPKVSFKWGSTGEGQPYQ